MRALLAVRLTLERFFFLRRACYRRWIRRARLLPCMAIPNMRRGFTHFDYANPDAPKGGMLKLAHHRHVSTVSIPLSCAASRRLGLATGYMSLVYEALMARSWDEPFTLYGLIAESVEVPDDRSSIIFQPQPESAFFRRHADHGRRCAVFV